MAAKELLYRGILLASSTLLLLLAGEAGLRAYLALTDPAVEDLGARLENSRRASPERAFGRGNLMGLVQASTDPEIVYELKPGLRGRFLGRTFAINSYGLRGRKVTVDKPPGTVRIAGLGDSVMFGWGVEQSETYLEVLEQRLNAWPGARFEVLNFAVPGYNTAIEAAVFERRALAFDPDLVVLHFEPNDLALPPFLQAPRRLGSMRRSYLLELVRNRLDGLAGLREPRLERRAAASPAGSGGEEVPERYRTMVGEEGFRRAAARLAARCRERSLPLIVILLGGSGEPWNLVRRVAGEEGFHLIETGPYHSSYLAEHGIEPSPRGWAETFWLSSRDHHPNPLGHRLLAQALFEQLESTGFTGAEPAVSPGSGPVARQPRVSED